MKQLASSTINQPVIIFLIVLGFAAAIALVAFIIYKVMHLKLKNDKDKPTEEEVAKEEMDRILKPIEDDDVASKVENYKEKEEDE